MAYFSNGAEGEVFNNECAECLFSEDSCPIFVVQSQFNYEACNNKTARAILNVLVTQDADYNYIGCQMKVLIDKEF